MALDAPGARLSLRVRARDFDRVLHQLEVPASLGRDPDCHIVLPAPSVSRKHLSFFWRDGRLFLRDHSSNGTRVNGRFIHLSAHKVDLDAEIHVGPYHVMLLEDPPPLSLTERHVVPVLPLAHRIEADAVLRIRTIVVGDAPPPMEEVVKEHVPAPYDPTTRKLEGDALQAQRELLQEERKTTVYRRRPASEPAPDPEQPVPGYTMFAEGSLEYAAPGAAGELAAQAFVNAAHTPLQRWQYSETYRVPYVHRGARLWGTVLLLSVLAALAAWNVAQQVDGARMRPPDRTTRAAVQGVAVPPVRGTSSTPASVRDAVELLFAGKRCAALAAYGALAEAEDSRAELELVATLLQHQLRAAGKLEGAVCVP